MQYLSGDPESGGGLHLTADPSSWTGHPLHLHLSLLDVDHTVVPFHTHTHTLTVGSFLTCHLNYISKIRNSPAVLVVAPEDGAVSLQLRQEELRVDVTWQDVPETREAGVLHLPHTLQGQRPLWTKDQRQKQVIQVSGPTGSPEPGVVQWLWCRLHNNSLWSNKAAIQTWTQQSGPTEKGFWTQSQKSSNLSQVSSRPVAPNFFCTKDQSSPGQYHRPLIKWVTGVGLWSWRSSRGSCGKLMEWITQQNPITGSENPPPCPCHHLVSVCLLMLFGLKYKISIEKSMEKMVYCSLLWSYAVVSLGYSWLKEIMFVLTETSLGLSVSWSRHIHPTDLGVSWVGVMCGQLLTRSGLVSQHSVSIRWRQWNWTSSGLPRAGRTPLESFLAIWSWCWPNAGRRPDNSSYKTMP